jgi:hypothetical protein
VEPLTGLSRRTSLILGAALVLGIVVSTVVTVVSVGGGSGCPDDEYGCARFEPGEDVVVGVLSPRRDVRQAVRLAVELRGGAVGGRPLRVLSWNDRCTPEGGAEGARQLATDAPDEPPVIGVVGETCGPAITPAAQILSDSGITLVSLSSTEIPSTAGRPRAYLGPGPVPVEQLQPFEAAYAQQYGPPSPVAALAAWTADALVEAAASVSRSDGAGSVLVPRIPLRDALLAEGFARLP